MEAKELTEGRQLEDFIGPRGRILNLVRGRAKTSPEVDRLLRQVEEAVTEKVTVFEGLAELSKMARGFEFKPS